jgi:molybdopterin converting factor small subunit
LFEKAKAEARAGQIAAGKFALQETKADRVAALATAKEKRKALAALGKEFRDENSKRRLEYIKHKNNMEIELLKADLKPVDAKGKVTTTTLEGNPYLKVDTAFITGSRNRVFLAPVQQAEKHANQYVNLLEAQNSIREVQDILKKLAAQPNKPSAIALLEGRVLSLLKPLGIGDTDYSQGVDKIIKEGTTPEQQVEAIQARLISQYKKFLTKETGNGVSEGDIERLKQLIGEIKVGQPIAANLNRLDQLSQIFAAPQRAIESQFKSFGRRENYRNEEEYLKTMNIINKAISTGTEGDYFSSFKDGVFTIDLRKR